MRRLIAFIKKILSRILPSPALSTHMLHNELMQHIKALFVKIEMLEILLLQQIKNEENHTTQLKSQISQIGSHLDKLEEKESITAQHVDKHLFNIEVKLLELSYAEKQHSENIRTVEKLLLDANVIEQDLLQRITHLQNQSSTLATLESLDVHTQALFNNISELKVTTEKQSTMLSNKNEEGIKDVIHNLSATAKEMGISTKELFDKLGQDITEKTETLTKSISTNSTEMEQNVKTLNAKLEQVRTISVEVQKSSKETLWAEVFNNTVKDSKWLLNKQVSPGRWAAGYPFLYILYRALCSIKPKNILELGLGESTKIISQYADASDDVTHYVVEHDSNWINFFKKDFAVSHKTEIIQLPWGFVPYKEAESVRIYDGFAERFAPGKYDIICIDGPLGGDMKEYARIDVLSLIPNSLAESFVIFIDDCNRHAEGCTINEILAMLDGQGISYKRGTYKGEIDTCVICSQDLAWLCTL